jgi:hypothetical protein
MPNSNDYRLKEILRAKISEAIEEMTEGDNDFGWLPDNTEATMTEVAFLILEHGRNLNEWLTKENLLKSE